MDVPAGLGDFAVQSVAEDPETAAAAVLDAIIIARRCLAAAPPGRGDPLGPLDPGDVVQGAAPAELAGRAFCVAYEPVWAIGTGLTPTTPEIEEVHVAIRATIVELFGEVGAGVPILYGGSVKPSNAAEILHAAEVGGALVGGASLKAADFLGIVEAL